MAFGNQDVRRAPYTHYFLPIAFICIIIALPSYGGITRYLDIDQGHIGPVIEVGSNLTLTCRMHEERNHDLNSSHIIWFERRIGYDDILIPKEQYEILDNESVSVHLYNMNEIKHTAYDCLFDMLYPEKYYLGGSVNVYVSIPPEMPTIECFNRNLMTMWCAFSESTETLLQKNFTMEYRLRVRHDETDSSVWRKCTQHDLKDYGDNTCFVDIDGHVGEDVYVRVWQSNALGRSPAREITYHMLENLKPSPVENFQVVHRSSTSITLTWEMPSDFNANNLDDPYMLDYLIRYTNLNNPTTSTNVTDVNLKTRYELTGLSPHSNYKLEILCYEMQSQKSDWTVLNVSTLEGAPGEIVQNLHITKSDISRENVYKRDVSLSWQDVPEESQHGQILGYSVYYMSSRGHSGAVNTTDMKIILKLERFDAYTVKVNAYTAHGGGPNASVIVKDNTTWPESFEKEGIEVTLADRSNSSLKIVWNKATKPSGIITSYELKWSPRNKPDWSEVVTLNTESGKQNIHKYEIKNLDLYTEYDVQMRFSNLEGPSKWMQYGPWYTQGGVPSQPLFQEPKKLSASETELNWEPPATTYDETVYYQVRYRPLPKAGHPALKWTHASQTTKLAVRVHVNCSMVRSESLFVFEVVAITNGLKSKAVTKQLQMCDKDEGPAMLLPILLALSMLAIITILIGCWLKQSDITKPAPEPYFIDAVLSPTESSKFQWREGRSSPKHEKERFDTLRSADSYTELLAPVIERMSSKDSSSASTDQGIHDMDIDSVDLKNSAPSSNSRRCNRYSSGMGQSILSECGVQGCTRSNSNPGMEVLSEDYEDAVFEEIPQDIDDGSIPCLSHTYARSSFNVSPPLTPNEEGIGSSSSLLSSGSAGPHSLPPYSQMAYNQHQRLSSSGSDSSGVNYHMMGSQGLAPISKDANDVGSLTYSKLSQIPTSPSPPPDVVVDLDHQATASDEDTPEYHQMGLRDPVHCKTDNSTDNLAHNNNKSPSHFNNIPVVDVGSLVRPQKEFIVATALMADHPQQKPNALKKTEEKCPTVKPSQPDVKKTPADDHSYSVLGVKTGHDNEPKDSPKPQDSARPKVSNANSPYVPNGCPNGFTIPNGIAATKPLPMSQPRINNGYVPNNSPPMQGVFQSSQPQSTNRAHSPPKGISDGYAPATPHSMSAIVQGRPLTNDGYVPNTTMV